MKKITLFLLALCVIAPNLLAQNKAPNDFQALSTKYKYRLKQYGQYAFGYNDKNQLIWEKDLEGYENEDAQYYIYDGAGYLAEKTKYYDGKLFGKYTFYSDENGYIMGSVFSTKLKRQELDPWIRYSYKYNEKKQLIGGTCEAFDPDTENWVIAHYVELTYNKDGNLASFVRKDNKGIVLTTENIIYNEKGQVIQLTLQKKIDGKLKTFATDYVYDDNGDVVTAGGRTHTHDMNKLTSETFFPRHTLHEIFYTGLANTFDGGLKRASTPLENGTKHVPVTTTTSSGKVYKSIYEEVPVENATAKVVNNDIRLYPTIVKDEINIEVAPEMIGNFAKIYNMEGKLVQSVKINSSLDKIAINLPKGNYILSIDQENSRFVVE